MFPDTAGIRVKYKVVGNAVPPPLFKAVAAALRDARAEGRQGAVVLLSPACASFDEFDSFEHRGREFKRMVGEMELKS